MFDLIIISIFVLFFSYLHSFYNNRNRNDVYFIFALTEIALIYSYLNYMKGIYL